MPANRPRKAGVLEVEIILYGRATYLARPGFEENRGVLLVSSVLKYLHRHQKS